jgi:thiol-disulfide isomerase/thioredoxin
MRAKNLRWLLFAALAALIAFVVYRYRQPRFVAGEAVPDIQFALPDGSSARLHELRGRPVLLQFWGSWCGPCRAENPHLVELYERHHASQGFEIFSVAIEQNPRSWQRAIEQDGMRWRYHTMEAGDFSGPLARQFNIHSIPSTFLLNKDGVITAVNPSPERIAKLLAAQ